MHAASVPAEAFGMNRNINLPGRSDTIGEMIDAMTRVAGPDAEKLITWEPDETVAKIALGWRGDVRHDKALKLGFKADRSFEDTVKWFLEDDIVR
jgi:nucleoside-diphosphate-sugar epimerase